MFSHSQILPPSQTAEEILRFKSRNWIRKTSAVKKTPGIYIISISFKSTAGDSYFAVVWMGLISGVLICGKSKPLFSVCAKFPFTVVGGIAVKP